MTANTSRSLAVKKKSRNSTAYMEGFYDGMAWQKAMQVELDEKYITNAVAKIEGVTPFHTDIPFKSLVKAIKKARKKSK